VSIPALADRFGVSTGTIKNILYGNRRCDREKRSA
jgi:hypothetical protein